MVPEMALRSRSNREWTSSLPVRKEASRLTKPMLLAAIGDRSGDFALELLPANDAIDEPVLQQELTGLEALGQLDADRGLDGPRPGEPDQGLGLGKDDVAQGGEAGGHAAHGRVGQHGDEQSAGLVESGQRRG